MMIMTFPSMEKKKQILVFEKFLKSFTNTNKQYYST